MTIFYSPLLEIPISALPSQIVSVVLSGQSCRINISQKSTGLFVNLYVNDALIVGGVICLNSVPIVRDAYLGFKGDLLFYDIQQFADPVYSDLGTRFKLLYMQ